MPVAPDSLPQRPIPELRTERLLLRGWGEADRAPFAALNADPEVMATLARPLDRAASDAFIDQVIQRWRERGFGLWAVERLDDHALIGMTGLTVPSWAPERAVEIGWRLARHAWGRGYATEAAYAVVAYAFDTLGLPMLVSYTAELNTRSRAVMERLGMTRDPAAHFEYPGFPVGHPLRPHVTYRLRRGTPARMRA